MIAAFLFDCRLAAGQDFPDHIRPVFFGHFMLLQGKGDG
jgi:hypothetical protein